MKEDIEYMPYISYEYVQSSDPRLAECKRTIVCRPPKPNVSRSYRNTDCRKK